MRAGGGFFGASAPPDWPEFVGLLVEHFHFQPSEIWEMEVRDIPFWVDRYNDYVERNRKK